MTNTTTMTTTTTATPVERESRTADGPLLEMRDLRVEARTRSGRIVLVDHFDFSMRRGEVRAIVGESGSGKSTVCLAALGLLAANARIAAGEIWFDGRRIDDASSETWRSIRGRQIGVVFQDPLSSLDPVRRVGLQLSEARRVHRLSNRRAANRWGQTMLGQLGFSHPARTARAFPGELSGGMRQRVCVGIAFSAEPQLVIADEPTTALDVSLQGRLLRLLLAQREAYDTSVLLVSHDVAVVRAVADRVTVMFGGEVLEEGDTEQVFSRPASPYTSALLQSVPALRPTGERRPLRTIPLATIPPTPGGCPFAGRCEREIGACRTAPPPRVERSPTHYARCFNPVPLPAEAVAQ